MVEIVEAFRTHLVAAEWRKAQSHFGGGGLSAGEPSLSAARRARAWFIKHKRPDLAVTLDSVVCGGGFGWEVLVSINWCRCSAVSRGQNGGTKYTRLSY